MRLALSYVTEAMGPVSFVEVVWVGDQVCGWTTTLTVR
jgi:hypothetical protein